MGLGKKIKKSYTKIMGKGPLSVFGSGKGGKFPLGYGKDSLWDKTSRELGHAAGYLTGYNQMKQMEEIANQQAAVQEQQLRNAERQAAINAGNQQQVEQAGTEQALAQLLKKRTALQRSIRTGGQQRLGD